MLEKPLAGDGVEAHVDMPISVQIAVKRQTLEIGFGMGVARNSQRSPGPEQWRTSSSIEVHSRALGSAPASA